MFEELSNQFITIAFLLFLTINLGVGIYHGRGIKDLKDYALGGRDFSTATLVATVAATFIGGGYIFITTYQVYTTGLYYALACWGIVICLLIIAYVFIPRMGEFLGSMSVTDAIGSIYGNKVRILTSFFASIGVVGYIAVQFKVLSAVFTYTLPINPDYATILASSVIIIYSAFGGIRSVAFTDIIQFFTFLVIIPLVAITIWNQYLNDPIAISRPIADHFNIENFLGFDNIKFWELLFLFMMASLPEFNPALFQRIAVGRSIAQVKKAFTITAFIMFCILIVLSLIAFWIYQIDPTLIESGGQHSVVQYIVDNYSNSMIVLMLLIGTAAMAMSSADSNLNATSVIITHDFIHQIFPNLNHRKLLFLSKIFTLVLGLIGIVIALYAKNMLKILFFTQSLSMPTVSVPLMMAAFGFRSSAKSVIIAMIMGVATVVIWENNWLGITANIESMLPAVIVSALSLIAAHYLLKQPGGLVGIKDKHSYEGIQFEKKRRINNFFKNVVEFNLIRFLKSSAPSNDLTYTGFGVFILISSLATISALDINFKADQYTMYTYEIILLFAFSFITYPLWPRRTFMDKTLQLLWLPVIFLILPFCSTWFLFQSKFNHIQLTIFTINMLVTMLLIRRKLSIFIVLAGILAGYQYFKHVSDSLVVVPFGTSSIICLFLILGCIFIVFLQPNFDEHKMFTFLNRALTNKIKNQSIHMMRLASYKEEFIKKIDSECIKTFNELNNRIKNLSLNKNSAPEATQKELEWISNKVVRGGEYLVDILKETDKSVKIFLEKKNANEFVDKIISDAKILNRHITTKVNIGAMIENIECDHTLVHDMIIEMIQYGISKTHKKHAPAIDISLSSTIISYPLGFTDIFKENVDGLIIQINCLNIESETVEANLTENKEFKNKFSRWQEASLAHYGEVKASIANGELSYRITLPSLVSKLRPKKLDIPDHIGQVFTTMHSRVYNEKIDFANKVIEKLIDNGLSKDLAKKIVYDVIMQ